MSEDAPCASGASRVQHSLGSSWIRWVLRTTTGSARVDLNKMTLKKTGDSSLNTVRYRFASRIEAFSMRGSLIHWCTGSHIEDLASGITVHWHQAPVRFLSCMPPPPDVRLSNPNPKPCSVRWLRFADFDEAGPECLAFRTFSRVWVLARASSDVSY